VRASLRYVDSTDSKAVVAALKAIYQSATAEEALRELDAFEDAWGEKYKAVVRLWRSNWYNFISRGGVSPAQARCSPRIWH